MHEEVRSSVKSTILRVRSLGSAHCRNYLSNKGRPCRSIQELVKLIVCNFGHSLSFPVCSPSLAQLSSIDYICELSSLNMLNYVSSHLHIA